MPVLNAADDLLMGAQPVLEVRRRGAIVWERPGVPVNTSPPVVSGATTVGDTAVATPGTWTNSPTSYAYQWQVDPGTGWENVPGETAASFEVEEAGEYRVQVIASNAAGASDPAYSAPFVVTEPSGTTYAVFTGTTPNGALSNGGRTLTHSSGDYAHALTTVALHEDCYLEFMVSTPVGDGGLGLYSGDVAAASLQVYAPLGLIWGYPALTAYGGDWSSDWWAFTGDASEDGGNVQSFGTAQSGVQYLQMAYRHSTRALWLRIRSGTTTYPWAGGGNPEAGTTPTFVWPNGDPIKVGASTDGSPVTLLLPDEFVSTPPTGFTLGLREV